MIICEACEKRRQWIKKWTGIAHERAKHLLTGNTDEPSTGNATIQLNKRPQRANASHQLISASDKQPDIG